MLRINHTKKNLLYLVMLIPLLLDAGCSRPPAVVNGEKIDEMTCNMLVQEKIKEHETRNLSPDIGKLRESVLQGLIAEKLMLAEAQKLGIQVTDKELDDMVESMKRSAGEDTFNKNLKDKGVTIETFKRRTKEEMVLLRFMQGFRDRTSVTEKEVREYYQKSPKPFIKPGRVSMRMVETKSEEAALAILDEMKINKMDFDIIAGRLSDEKRAIVSDYGWVNPASFSPSISLAARELKIGEYGGPYKGKKNYFLIRVKDREEDEVAQFDDVEEEIYNTLIEQKNRERFAHWLEEEKKTADIKINIH